MGYINLTRDSDGIVELIFDQPGKSVNTMGAEYNDAMQVAIVDLERMVADQEIIGVYVRSAKPGQFFAGGDITEMLEMDLNCSSEKRAEMFAGIVDAKAPFRRLETLGVPVVVGINGACLGGGYEIALSCHYRIALNNVMIGLPEAMIGLMPGAGGVVRLTRLLGMEAAIGLISTGRRLKSERAIEQGMIDELVDDEDQLAERAKVWIKANPAAKQPWDAEGYSLPGGDLDDPANQGLSYFGPVNVVAKTNDLMPAQKAIFACVLDSTKVDFDTAQMIESRYFLSLLLDQTSRNMMLAFFVQMEALNKGASRPRDIEKTNISTLGLIGAGQMGAGIAMAAAQNGINVILKDINQKNADNGKAYAAAGYQKNKRVSDQQAVEYLSRIQATADYADMSDCELVIEAVFEDRDLKAIVTNETEYAIADSAVVASNTSALPITELAEASSRPENFIGMHFFSPVEKMPLVEIIRGAKTSDLSLAKAFDLVQKLGKTPIVVGDGPGFFTTRTIATTITEGARMVIEGINPVLIESAARDNGSPVGPLAAIDEISQETAYKNGQQMKADAEAQGKTFAATAAAILIDRMVNEFDRKGKRFGGGYYDYPEGGKKTIWSGLKEHFAPNGYQEIPYQDIRDRLLFCQSLEAVRAMEDGVVCNTGDANIGSIMGIGFPAQTGGVLQFINAYGLPAFVQRCNQLETLYGDVFTPPQLLMERAESGVLFL